MTVHHLPLPPTEPPQLLLPIAAVTLHGTAHHLHPAASDHTLCMVPIDFDAASYGPTDPNATGVQPITCPDCAATIEEAYEALATRAVTTPERTAQMLRNRAGGLLATAHMLHPIEVDE